MKHFILFLILPFNVVEYIHAQNTEKIESLASVEVLPEFPGGGHLGGYAALDKYIRSSIKYSKKAKKNGVDGSIVVSFIVEKDGTLTDIKIHRGLGYGCDEEVIRVLKASPKWNPGIKHGRPVRVEDGITMYILLIPEDVHTSAEILPEYPGGRDAFDRYLQRSVKYSEEAKKNGVDGKVILSFIVEKDGRLTDIKVRRDLGFGTGEEVMRVLKASQKWKPGMQNGRTVRAYYTLHLTIEGIRNQ